MIWWVCFIIVCVQFLLVILLRFVARFKLSSSNIETGKNANISVIIPFYNESDRIIELINSLNKCLINQGVELLFIDDHSTDNSVELIEQNLKHPFKIISNSEQKGKKFAIKKGVKIAQYETIITWDADIQLPSDYFIQIQQLQTSDMAVLPVNMKANSLIGALSIIEFKFLSALNFGLASINHPILANGANLLFSKKAFLKVDKQRNDYLVPSGDDVFLLNAFLQNNLKVELVDSSNCAVTTQAPGNIVKLLQQRKRWAGKINRMLSAPVILGFILLLAVQVLLFISLINLGKNPLFGVVIGLKYLAELILIWRWETSMRMTALTLLLHQIWYPFYGLLMLVPLKKENKWNYNSMD